MDVPIYTIVKQTARPWLVKLAQMPDVYLYYRSLLAAMNACAKMPTEGDVIVCLFIRFI